MGNGLFTKRQPAIHPQLAELREDLAASRRELHLAYERFDAAVDAELVDACIYQINALQMRCNYLIRMVKAMEDTSGTRGEAEWTCGR